MCGRATLTKSVQDIEQRLQAKLAFPEQANLLPNFNVAPTHYLPVVTNEFPGVLQFYKWGLIPFWAKDEKIGSRLINARIETIMEKPAFRGIKYRRCLIALDSFYEWRRMGKKKQPYRIQMTDESIFTVAGVWERWTNPQGAELYSFTIITQAANEIVGELHDRMPAILLPEQERLWLDNDIPVKEAIGMIEPYPSELMMTYPVSPRVNKVSENDEELLRRIDIEG